MKNLLRVVLPWKPKGGIKGVSPESKKDSIICTVGRGHIRKKQWAPKGHFPTEAKKKEEKKPKKKKKQAEARGTYTHTRRACKRTLKVGEKRRFPTPDRRVATRDCTRYGGEPVDGHVITQKRTGGTLL